jgi:hypothetical protein
MDDLELYNRLLKLISVTNPPVDLSDLNSSSLYRLFSIARIHGVLGIVLSKYPHDEKMLPWSLAHRAWKSQIKKTLLIRHHGKSIVATLNKSGISASVIKGCDFADHLYISPNQRNSIDVDILVPKEQWFPAIHALENMGHTLNQQRPQFFPFGVIGERTWSYNLNSEVVEVDLHWNIVGEPGFRKLSSIGYWDLDFINGEITPASRVLIAAAHALYHHQFDHLCLFADLQRSCKCISTAEEQSVKAIARRTHSSLCLKIAIEITAKYLQDQHLAELGKRLMDGLNLPSIPSNLLENINRNIYSIHSPTKRWIRNWLNQQPAKPEAGHEFEEGQMIFY